MLIPVTFSSDYSSAYAIMRLIKEHNMTKPGLTPLIKIQAWPEVIKFATHSLYF